nr:hypothetical protein [Streptomyces sp. 846.5]
MDEIDHPLIAKAQEQFADPCTPHERIAAVDDQVLFKVKVGRWCGAVWLGPPRPRTPHGLHGRSEAPQRGELIADGVQRAPSNA